MTGENWDPHSEDHATLEGVSVVRAKCLIKELVTWRKDYSKYIGGHYGFSGKKL